MKYNVELLSSVAEIQNSILSSLSEILQKAISKSVPEIQRNMKTLVQQSLKTEPEYLSLTGGDLRYHFGIADVSNVDRVIDAVTDTLNIQINKISSSNQGLTGGLIITMLGAGDLNNIIASNPAQVRDSERGYSLPWLEWLLLRNNEIIINNYDVKFGPNPSSRTGNAVMIKSDNSWRVPPAFAGSADSNWITRSLNKINEDIINIITKAISNKL